VGRRLKYGVLWLLLGITGVWWVDLQIDGVKRGYVYTFIQEYDAALWIQEKADT
jgi:hypothetical protein